LRAPGGESRAADQYDAAVAGTEVTGPEVTSTGETGTAETSTEEHGAVRLRTPDGRVVVTRPGSFGDDDSLLTIIRAVRPGSFRSIRQTKGTS
jgi:4-hydroxythreonine-4-phosphate dehydrogenase